MDETTWRNTKFCLEKHTENDGWMNIIYSIKPNLINVPVKIDFKCNVCFIYWEMKLAESNATVWK